MGNATAPDDAATGWEAFRDSVRTQVALHIGVYIGLPLSIFYGAVTPQIKDAPLNLAVTAAGTIVAVLAAIFVGVSVVRRHRAHEKTLEAHAYERDREQRTIAEAARRDDRFATFIATIEADTHYRAWESAEMQRLYPTHAFTLLGMPHVAICVPAPKRFSGVRDRNKPMIYDDLVAASFTAEMSPATIVDSEPEYTKEAQEFLAYMMRSRRVNAPERPGFEPVAWHLEAESGPLVTLGVTRFRDMTATVYDLQAELFERYERFGRHEQPTPEYASYERRRKLGLHGDALPTSRPGYRPMLGVQALTVLYDRKTPKFTTFTRVGERISTRPGWKQFPPSGAMETFGKPNSGEGFIESSDPGDSLLREFVEELFGVTDFENPEAYSHYSLRRAAKPRLLLDALENGCATVRFLGIVADPVSFRAELSFLIVVEDLRWELKRSSESAAAPEPLTLDGLAAWLRDGSGPLNPPSAGLLKLAITSGALAEAGVADQAALDALLA